LKISFPTIHVSLPVPQGVIHIEGRKSTGKREFLKKGQGDKPLKGS
jgi:hypothetical protein